jgi:hypothetical protein
LGVRSDYPCGKAAGFCWWATKVSGPLSVFEFFLQHSRALDYLDQRIRTFARFLAGSTSRDENGNLVITEAGYENWRNRLYQPDVFSMWERAVADFSRFSRHPFLFLLTTDLTDATEEAIRVQVADSLRKAGAPYVDCREYTAEYYVFGILPRRFWANPANGHPGAERAQGYARCLYSKLDLERNLIASDRQKREIRLNTIDVPPR